MRASRTALRVALIGALRISAASAQPLAPGPGAEPGPERPAARTMTLAEALAYAHAHQPLVLAALARVQARAEEAKIPSAQWLPSVGVTAQVFAGTTNNTPASYVNTDALDIPRIGGTTVSLPGTWRPYPSTFVGAGVNQEVFDFGRIAAQRAAADALVDVQKQAASIGRLDVDYGILEAYYAVYAAKSVLTVSEEAYTRAKAHRDLAKAGVDSGLRSPIERSRAEAALARFDIGRIRAHGGVTVAQSVLAAAVGVPEVAVDVAGDAPRSAEMPDLAEAMRQAAARDPRVLQALAQLKADQRKTRAIGAEMRPDLWGTGTISGRAGGAPAAAGTPTGDGFVPYVPNWDVGLVLTWPLFDGTIRAREHASRAQEQVRREELDLAREQRVAAIEQAYVGFDVARTALPGLRQAVTAAQANYAQADARFKAGLGTAVELADAEDLRASAEIGLALGIFDVARTRAVFGRAIAEGL